MICHEYQCLFVHIPKTAGQSVEQFFIDLLNLSWEERSDLLLRKNFEPSQGPPRLAHLTAQEYINYKYINYDLFKSYYKFSFVRNPWSRIVSEYRYRYANLYDFKTFVLKELPQSNSDCYQKSLDRYRHILPQYNFLFDSEGKQLVDFIGKFENLQRDFELVCKQLGISPNELPYRNKTLERSKKLNATNFREKTKLFFSKITSSLKLTCLHKNYAWYYDEETKDFVAHLYKKDINYFKYQFGE